jgi:hypothetical protein
LEPPLTDIFPIFRFIIALVVTSIPDAFTGVQGRGVHSCQTRRRDSSVRVSVPSFLVLFAILPLFFSSFLPSSEPRCRPRAPHLLCSRGRIVSHVVTILTASGAGGHPAFFSREFRYIFFAHFPFLPSSTSLPVPYTLHQTTC